ncbi:MAG: DUF3810 family protein [Gemmatimonadetes bacterium]|nr:DUF3810 domain-containing protein [Gemmatimonadota bacterium]NIR79222.1 DUF3810 domain-containing protein [Gemmatimonadota bacterium]NIT87883.1 DUF3810 domain-containing protein [Gemmatimonadota bacterium]NIU31738.1 DUF3810 domain-containing protein [Gemmatimonadota bacterium]NIU36355.1 DUF3810 family protein [Gemmatimonadota bacterium]
MPELTDTLYGGSVAALVIPTLSRVTGAVPFTLVEPLLLAYLAWKGTAAARGIVAVRRGSRSTRDLLQGGGLVALRDLGAAVLLFYFLWGFHYARGPAAQRMGLPSVEAVTTAELRSLGEETVDRANDLYRRIHGTSDRGTPTAMPDRRDAMERALARGWAIATHELSLPAFTAASYGSPKALTLSRILVRLGLMGFYFPWTAEAVVNGEAPAVIRGRSTAHEQAHQRGITSEGEATFAGYVAAIRSGDSLLRYSATVDAQLRILQALDARDPGAARALRDARSPGVARDLADLADFRERMRGTASNVATRVNDAYLRANRVPGGVESYGTATILLLRYARARGGTLEPGAGPAASGSTRRSGDPGPAPTPN